MLDGEVMLAPLFSMASKDIITVAIEFKLLLMAQISNK